jgi:DNA helicase-2/ATP-dependent DNA helicase PcrA
MTRPALKVFVRLLATISAPQIASKMRRLSAQRSDDFHTRVMHQSPTLVIAGAGTGKTKTLTAAVAYRIATLTIPPSRILAVTFTNKAAAEMTGRIKLVLGDTMAPNWAGTFQGLGARQLRIEP